MKTTLPKEERWDARMPAELRLPQVRYSRSRFVCRADFPPHILERSGMIMHRRAQRIERQTEAREAVLKARREWHAKHGTKVSTPPANTEPDPDAQPATLSLHENPTAPLPGAAQRPQHAPHAAQPEAQNADSVGTHNPLLNARKGAEGGLMLTFPALAGDGC